MSRLRQRFFPEVSSSERRTFLKRSGLLALLPLLSSVDRLRLFDIFGGEAFAQELQAQEDADTIFIEINLRDQWDFGHIFIPPGLARFPLLKRGDKGEHVAIFDDPSQILQAGHNFYLTQDALPLKPHLDHIAMVDTFELCIGMVHGHEAGNPLRSPGRTKSAKSGYALMSVNDPGVTFANEILYSRTPTPAIVHNLHNFGNAKRNGIALKGIGRPGVTAYHFDAGLTNGQLDRFYKRDDLLQAFSKEPANQGYPINAKQAAYIRDLMMRLDKRFILSRPYKEQIVVNHFSQLKRIIQPKSLGDFSLPLTAAEEAYWLSGIPAQVSPVINGLEIGHQMAYAFKLCSAGIVKTVAMEYDYADFHGDRNEALMRTQARQVAIPLARLIQSLKDQGLFHKTLIALYTTDGSRSPSSNSYGDQGKNSLMLVGGMIRGGYYGDIKVADSFDGGHSYSYHAPDPQTGRALAQGARDNSGRLPGASAWRTVMKGLKIPELFQEQYPDAMEFKALDFMLR